jgi:hypothetical protein
MANANTESTLRSELAEMDSAKYAILRNAFYDAMEGLRNMAYMLDAEKSTELARESLIASKALKLMEESNLGKYL